jgi:hypothetical protein
MPADREYLKVHMKYLLIMNFQLNWMGLLFIMLLPLAFSGAKIFIKLYTPNVQLETQTTCSRRAHVDLRRLHSPARMDILGTAVHCQVPSNGMEFGTDFV